MFSAGITQGMYSFHASAAAYKEYWNNSFWRLQLTDSKKPSCQQIWNIFVQESIHSIATEAKRTPVLRDDITLNEVTKEAFSILGDGGIICAVDGHCCSECTHTYKKTSDIVGSADPTAMVNG
jgi:hypothetical protein